MYNYTGLSLNPCILHVLYIFITEIMELVHAFNSMHGYSDIAILLMLFSSS